jgi:hypothetical protein
MDDNAPEEESSPPAPKKTRRVFLTTLLAAGGGGLLATRMVDNRSGMDERDARKLGAPIGKLKSCELDLAGTIQHLKLQGYNLFCLGDLNHNSPASLQTVGTLVRNEDINVTDLFVESPELGKSNGVIDKALSKVSYQRDDSPRMQQADTMFATLDEKKKAGRIIALHKTDSYLGPDHVHTLTILKSDSDLLLERLHAATQVNLNGAAVLDGFDRDVDFRSDNMSTAIARKFTAGQKLGQKNFCGLFPVGISHLRGEKGVPALLAKSTAAGLKVATIDILPVKLEAMDGRLWQLNNKPNHFVLTCHDPVHGKTVLPDLSVRDGEDWYIFPRQRQQSPAL